MKAKVFLLTLGAFCLLTPAPAQDRAFDRFKHYDSIYFNGNGETAVNDGGDLAWGESPFLESYINLYNAYRDPYWLEKFTAHFDEVISKAQDLEGDGYYGWYTPKYSYLHLTNEYFELDAPDSVEPESVLNPGFESAGADSVPADWTREAGTNTTVYRTTVAGEYFTGSAGLAVKDNGASAATLRSSTFTLAGDRRHILTWKAKTNALTTTAKVEIYRVSAGVYTLVAGSATYGQDAIIRDSWSSGGVVFMSSSGSSTTYVVKIRLGALNNSGWAAYFDDISVKPVETVPNAIQNGTFETGTSGDATLGDKWARLGTSTHTYLSSVAGEYYSGSKGQVVKSDGTAWKEVYQQIPYVPGSDYTLSVWARTNSSSAYGRILVYNATDSVYVLDQTFNNTSWQKLSYTFTAPSAADKVLYVYLRQSSYTQPSWIAYFDDLEIEKYTENVLQNFNFEAVDGSDTTLPQGWERYQSTSSNALLTTTLNEYYGYYNGLVIKSNSTQIPMLRRRIFLVPGMPYTVRFMGRNNIAAANGRVEIYNSTTSTVLGSKTFTGLAATQWGQRTFSFTAPSTLTDVVQIRLGQNSTATNDAWITYFDDIEIVPAVPRSMNAWTRVNKTATNAYTSCRVDESVGGFGLVIGNDGSTDGHVMQRIVGYAASKPLSVSFYARTSDAANDAKVIVYDVTAGSELGSASVETTSFSSGRIDFTTPANASNVLEVRLKQQFSNNAAQYAYFDRIQVGQRANFLVHDGVLARPALKFIKTVKEDAGLDLLYGAAADEYLEFIEDALLPKWEPYFEDLPSGRGIYVLPNDHTAPPSFAGRSVAHNMHLAVAECYLLLGDIQNNSSYTTRAQALLSLFKDKLTTSGTAYVWNYWDPTGSWDDSILYDNAEEDTSHGNLDISAAMMGYRYGVVFNATDVGRLASTFLDVMWNGSLSSPFVGAAVHHSIARTDLMGGIHDLWGWLQLAEVDPEVRDVIEAIVDKRHTEADKTYLGYTRAVLANLAVYNPEMLLNGEFDGVSVSDSTMPAHWQRYLANTTSSTAYRDTTNVFRGSAGLASKSNGTSWNIVQQQMRNYLQNTPYTLHLRGKAGSTSVQGRADVFNYTTVAAVGSVFVDDTSWESASLAFTTPNNTTDVLKVDLYHNLYSPSNLFAYFDDVRVYAALWDSFAPNGGFEQADGSDSTLPRYWTRETGTVNANAALDTAEKYKGTASAKLTTNTPAGAQRLSYTVQGYVPGVSYTVTVYAKTNGSLAKAKVRIANDTTATTLDSEVIDNTAWAQYTLNFTAPATATNVLKIYLEHDNPAIASGTAYFDQIGLFLD